MPTQGYSICYYNFYPMYGPLGDLFYQMQPITKCVLPQVALNFTEAFHIEKMHHWPGLDASFDKHFVAMITGYVSVTSRGNYDFWLRGTNSVEMRVDGTTLFTLGYTGASMSEGNTTLALEPGRHLVEVYYVCSDLFAKLSLAWRPQDGEWQLLDPDSFRFGGSDIHK